MPTVAEAPSSELISSAKQNPEDLELRLRKAVEAALRDQKEGELQTVQGEIDSLATKAVAAHFEPFREEAERLLRILRSCYALVARFVQGDFRKEPSFYLGQLYLLAEMADKLRQRRLPKDVIELVASSGRAVDVLRTLTSLGSVGASELAEKIGMQESNLSALCGRLVDREIMRADRYGQRLRYSPTPLTHAVLEYLGESASSKGTPTGSASQVQGSAPDWSKNLAAAAVASFEDGNVMANTSDFTSVLLTLGLLRDANAVVIDPSKNEVRIEKRDSKKESKLPLPKSVEPLLMQQIKACSLHSGGEKSQPLFFDWRGQKLRAIRESSHGKPKYRIEFFDRPKKEECQEKVQTAFQEMEQEKSRLEDALKFYAREVASTFDNEYPAAAKTLGIKVPELKSILRT
ncbi:MAG: hypothetical protein ACM3JB_28020 [Acidobacteriaceae bacterium]